MFSKRKHECMCVSSRCRRDSISSLPDEILGKILSSLPTKLAASTSVLSKRWRNLLPLVDSSLDFDDSFFLYPERDEEEEARSSSGFSEFVDKTLALLSKSPIKSLSVNGSYEKCRLDGWIRTAVQQRSLSELHLRCNHRIDRDSEFLFFRKTLVKLTLSGGCSVEFFPREKKVLFPVLKSLYLGHVSIDEDDYYMLVKRCPLLEELFIHNEEDDPKPSWPRNVPGDSMKRLVIYYHAPKYRDLYEDEVYLLQKKLVYLDYSSYVSGYYVAIAFESLVEVRLDLRLWEPTIRYDDDEDEHFSDIFGDASSLFANISPNVRTLHLSSDSLESDKDKGWHLLPRLLRNAPNLKTLVIKGLVHRVTSRCGDVCPCFHPRHKVRKVSCLPNLPVKVLEISGYGGTRRELQQMKHFLEKLKCLQLVKIRLQPEADNNYLRLKLRALPRLSSKCDIHFI